MNAGQTVGVNPVIDVDYEQPATVGASACLTKHAWARVPVEPGPSERGTQGKDSPVAEGP